MDSRDDYSPPAPNGLGLAVFLLTALAGAAALLLATEPGRKLLGQASDRADALKAQAAATLAETREKVVTSVEADAPPADPGPQVRTNL